ncbi:NAD-dependent dihydropyrimidine dehydrogenase subunit PreA, partial [Tetrabaena socialis]
MQQNLLRSRTGRAACPCPSRRSPRHFQPRSAVASGIGSTGQGLDDPIQLVDGRVTSGPDLSVEVNGLKLPNPFIIGSGPPGTNYQVMKKAFDEGWGGVICKASGRPRLRGGRGAERAPEAR